MIDVPFVAVGVPAFGRTTRRTLLSCADEVF
jgi:hypothetical protein